MIKKQDDRDKCYLENPRMREKFERFIKLAEENDWSIYVNLYEEEGARCGELDIECQKYSPAEQDFLMYLQPTNNADVSFADLIHEWLGSYNPAEEAILWSEETGEYDENGYPIRVGVRGAPHDYADLFADMKECKKMVEELEKMTKEEML